MLTPYRSAQLIFVAINLDMTFYNLWLVWFGCHALRLRRVGAIAEEDHLFDWDITPISMDQRNGIKEPMMFTYRIPSVDHTNKECSFQLLSYSCDSTEHLDFPSAIKVETVDTYSVDQRLLVAALKMDLNAIGQSGYYTEIDSFQGKVEFCVRVDCMLDGESISFHETMWRLTLDFLAGFALQAEMYNAYSKYKTLYSYAMTFYKTDGDLGDSSLRLFEIAVGVFLTAELNQIFDNPVQIYATIKSQTMVTKQVEVTERRLLEADSQPQLRHLQQYETGVGSELDIGLEANFANEPAPHTDEVNDAQQYIFINKADFLLSNITAIIGICDSELMDIAESEYETAKEVFREDYVNGELVNETFVNQTINEAFSDMSYEELLYAEAAVDACKNVTDDLDNVTDVCCATPEKQEGKRNDVSISISLGLDVIAYFCDDDNNLVPDPLVRQGETVTFCVTRQDSSRWHVEEILTAAFTQAGVEEAQYVVSETMASPISRKRCTWGVCNIKAVVKSRFFTLNAGPIRIVGVAINALGSPDERRRTLSAFSSERNLQDNTPMNPFQLYFDVVSHLLGDDADDSNTSFWLPVGIIVGFFIVLAACCCCFFFGWFSVLRDSRAVKESTSGKLIQMGQHTTNSNDTQVHHSMAEHLDRRNKQLLRPSERRGSSDRSVATLPTVCSQDSSSQATAP